MNNSNNSKDVISTMLIPLWARAVEQIRKDPIIIDGKSLETMSLLGYGLDYLDMQKQRMSQVGCCLRGKWIDDEVKKFIDENDGVQVIQLGAGLDARFQRIENVDKIRYWYDLDLPDAMAVRKKVIPAESENNLYLEMSLFDEEWMRLLSSNNLPTLIIAEGVFMYFDDVQLKDLFSSIRKYFPQTTFLLDSVPSYLVGKARHHDSLHKHNKNVEFTWGVETGEDLCKLNEGIKIEKFEYMSDLPRADRFPKIFRLLYKIPFFHKRFNQRLIRFRLLGN